MRRGILTFLLIGGVVAIVSCKHGKERGGAKTQARAADHNSVHTITLPHYQANLPPGPGREAFAVGCLTCHSTRYITTQPPLTAAKWEESVRKMMKTYAAPIAEDQVPIIVQYLMTAREKGDPGSWETPVVVPAARPMAFKTIGGDPAHGGQLYAQRCASCHGQSGAADTPAALTMLPRPTDLTSGRFWAANIAVAIVEGVPGTAMPGSPGLSNSDLSDLVAYSAHLAPPADAAPPPGDLADAKALYVKNCVSCHGANGEGNGPVAAALARTPANFHLRQPSSTQAARVIADGVPGTAMAAWKSKLTEPQRQQLAEYVRTFYRDDEVRR